MTVQDYLNKLIRNEDLSIQEAEELLDLLTKEESNSRIAGVLTALASKGETTEEMIGFIQGMRKKKLFITMSQEAVDVCGTGGDGSGTFNISTAVSFVVAGAGVPVVKHGNRAASSRCGSADVLEALGVHIQLSCRQAEDTLKKVSMVFLYAPIFHPSFKHVGIVRKELGIRTIFNYLGPFVNPAAIKRQLIGVPSEEIAAKLANVASKLGYKKLYIVTSQDGLDEVSIFAKTFVYEVSEEKIKTFTINPTSSIAKETPLVSLKESPFLSHQSQNVISDSVENPVTQNDKLKLLQGGDAKENAQIILRILQGEKGPKRDIVVFNSAVALCVAGEVETIEDGIGLAEASIDSKKAMQVLKSLRKETQKYA